jgi:hypothetical protein
MRVDGGFGLPGEMASDPDGSFRVAQVQPGRYYLMPQFGAGYYPASVLMDGREVLGQPVDLLGGSLSLKLIYKTAQGAVRGKVAPGAAAFLGPDLRNTLEPAIMKKAIAQGVPVRVEQAGSVSLELKPIDWLQ